MTDESLSLIEQCEIKRRAEFEAAGRLWQSYDTAYQVRFFGRLYDIDFCGVARRAGTVQSVKKTMRGKNDKERR